MIKKYGSLLWFFFPFSLINCLDLVNDMPVADAYWLIFQSDFKIEVAVEYCSDAQ